MTILAPMRAEAYASYMQLCAINYVEGNVTSGYWLKEGALERSHAEFERMLPQSLATPDNHFFEILADEDSQSVGFIWITITDRHNIRDAWVSYIEVKPEFRRQGYATRAFREVEDIAVALGVSSIGLHVFSHNQEAQAFYRKLGFIVPGINMIKQISGSARDGV